MGNTEPHCTTLILPALNFHVSNLLPHFFSDPINPANVRHRKTTVLMASLKFLFAPRTHQESNIVVTFAIQALSSSSCFIVNVDLGNWSFPRFWCSFGYRNHSLRFQRWATKFLMIVQRSRQQQRATVATFYFLSLYHALVLQQEEVPEESRQSLPTQSRCCCCLRPFGQEDFLDHSHVFVCVCPLFFSLRISSTNFALASFHLTCLPLRSL